jgi:hypothetical protein
MKRSLERLVMTTRDITKRQSWAIFSIYGYDVRESDLTFDEASELIGAAKDNFDGWNQEELVSIIEESGGKLKKKVDPKVNKSNMYRDLYDEADKAGREAVSNTTPTPMIVRQHSNPLDDSSEVVKEYGPILDGVCGFAWINIKPGNHPFCNWLKKEGLARKDSYYGGVTIWVHDFEQSLEKKQAYAQAFAKVINKAFDNIPKFNALAMSRMD